MNIKLLQIDAIETRINHIKRLNSMMEDNWGTYTNQPGWDALEHEYLNRISDKSMFKNMEGLKPFLCDMYIKINNEIISSLEYQLRKINEQPSS